MENDEPIFDPSALEGDRRRYEWISLPGLGRICIREMLLPEHEQAIDYGIRPAGDPRGGVDRLEMVVWEIAFSCMDGPGEEARRLFDDRHLHLIKRLKWDEYRLIRDSIARVNGESATEEELLRDFTPATTAAPG